MPRPAPTSAPGRLLMIAAAGFVGVLLMAILPFSVGFLPSAFTTSMSEFFPHLRTEGGRYASRAAGALGAAMLFWAWTAVHPSHMGQRHRWLPYGLLALWAVPTLVVPPMQTADPWAYAAQGWLLSQGRDPYSVPMGVPGPFASGIFDSWLSTTAVYPPVSLVLQMLIVDATGAHWYWSVVAMRLIPIVGLALMALVARPLARDLGVDPDVAVWAALLNPLVITQYLGGAHNDALMSALIVVAFWLAGRRGGLWWSAMVIGLAAAVKQPAVLAGLGVAVHAAWPQVREHTHRWRQLALRVTGAGILGGATFLGLSFATGLGLGWTNDTAGAPTLVISHTPISWVSQLLIRAFHVSPGVVGAGASIVSGVLTIAAIMWAIKRFLPEQPVAWTAAALLAFGLLGAALQPWYPLWGGILLAWTRLPRRWALVLIAATGGLGISAVLQEFWSPAATVPLCALAAYGWWRWQRDRLLAVSPTSIASTDC